VTLLVSDICIPASYVNEDLLGLEDFGNESQHGSSLCSSFDGSDMYYSSNVQSHSEMSSLGVPPGDGLGVNLRCDIS
jgi:hypothetical protein